MQAPSRTPWIPRVSVIVPVLDGAGCITACLAALRAQTWPADRLEIVVVDNGSADETRARVRAHHVTLVVERRLTGPAAARNAGLAHAHGEVLAFTDASAIPAKDWVERGVAALDAEAADLAGGPVVLATSRPPRLAELADALANPDNETLIATRATARAANLFVHRRVIDEIGRFDGRLRSGADLLFTARASGAGFHLTYAIEAAVVRRARGAFALLHQQFRIGRDEGRAWCTAGLPLRERWRRVRETFAPPGGAAVRRMLARRGVRGVSTARLRLFSWTVAGGRAVGQLSARARRRRAPRSTGR